MALAPDPDLRDHPARLALALAATLAAATVLALAFRRWPRALPLVIVFVLPFRVPLEAGGETANLLVPLYLVIAAGVLAAAIRDWGARPTDSVAPAAVKWLLRVLAAVVALYGFQVLYSSDFSKGLQDLCSFYVPFAVAFVLLSDLRWDRKLLTGVLWLVAIEALLFVAVGSIEYATRGLFWNHQVIRSNEFHTYFRVNSVFWDPNIYGRYLALAIVVAMAALLWAKQRRNIALLAGLVGILWIGLVPTYSESSFIALLAGLAVLAALRWSLKWTLGVVGVGAVVAISFVALVGGSSKINFERLNIDTSGRAHLVSGGIRLFDQRPIYGYGSGSFSTAYRAHAAKHRVPVSVSNRADHHRSRARPPRPGSLRSLDPHSPVDDDYGPAGIDAWPGRLSRGAGWGGAPKPAEWACGPAGRSSSRPRRLRGPLGSHHGLRGLLRRSDHLGSPRSRGVARGQSASATPLVAPCRATSAA